MQEGISPLLCVVLKLGAHEDVQAVLSADYAVLEWSGATCLLKVGWLSSLLRWHLVASKRGTRVWYTMFCKVHISMYSTSFVIEMKERSVFYHSLFEYLIPCSCGSLQAAQQQLRLPMVKKSRVE